VALGQTIEGRWESNFGSEAPFALGVEEELLVVGEDNELLNRGPQAPRDAEPEAGEVDAELFKAMLETRSEVSANARKAVAELRDLRRELLDSGTRIMGAGVHPNAAPGEAAVHQNRRYALTEDTLQGVLRTPICGQHIHVGMPDAETAVRAHNGIRAHVPLLNALASNSPLASSRSNAWRRPPRSPASSAASPSSTTST
jgi:carboxylate-amine ligase